MWHTIQFRPSPYRQKTSLFKKQIHKILSIQLNLFKNMDSSATAIAQILAQKGWFCVLHPVPNLINDFESFYLSSGFLDADEYRWCLGPCLAKSMVLDMSCKHFVHMLACADISTWRHRLSAIACTPHVCPLHARSYQSWSMQKSYAEAQPDCHVLQNPAHLAGKAFVPLVWQYNMAMAVRLSLSLSRLGIHPGPPGLLYYTNKVYVTVSWKKNQGHESM